MRSHKRAHTKDHDYHVVIGMIMSWRIIVVWGSVKLRECVSRTTIYYHNITDFAHQSKQMQVRVEIEREFL